jgi:hypothetical protein
MAATQKGTTLKISFGSFAYTGYIAQDLTHSKDDENVEINRNADGATVNKIFMDPSTKITLNLLIADTSGSITPPTKGASVGLIPPTGTLATFMVDSAEVAHAAGATKLSLTLIKEDSMTYV